MYVLARGLMGMSIASLNRTAKMRCSRPLASHGDMLGELFDPQAEFAVNERLRPHWSQAGAIVFITFRTIDSMPREVLERWEREKHAWLDQRGVRQGRHWKDVVPHLEPKLRAEFTRHFQRCREDFLDTCRGACVLRDPKCSRIVADSLLYFDADRYLMGDFVVMPNHVHLLVAFSTESMMQKQCESWLHFTAREINRRTNQSGHFWQQEPFDHLVRSVEQYEYLREYIAANPSKAGLTAGDFHYRRRPD